MKLGRGAMEVAMEIEVEVEIKSFGTSVK